MLWLTKGLVELGHRVYIGARRGSRLPDGAVLLPFDPAESSARDLLKKIPRDIDVVHFMAPPEEGVIEMLECAALLTVHGNGKKGEIFPLNTVFLSRDHAERHGASVFVYNGIDPAEYIFNPNSETRDHLLFLSKTTWSVKNLRGAISVCSRAKRKLIIAGGERPVSLRAKSLFIPGAKWIGSVAGRTKAELIANAQALIFPIIWPEPFGLVIAEALMSGTPVLASPRGSVPELLTPQVGAIIEDHKWVEVLRNRDSVWKPEDCRARAMQLFHYRKMAESYERLYHQLKDGKKLHDKNPVGQGFVVEKWRSI